MEAQPSDKDVLDAMVGAQSTEERAEMFRRATELRRSASTTEFAPSIPVGRHTFENVRFAEPPSYSKIAFELEGKTVVVGRWRLRRCRGTTRAAIAAQTHRFVDVPAGAAFDAFVDLLIATAAANQK